jgi:hypothetical protein
MALGSNGQIPVRVKPPFTCLGVRADLYSSSNSKGRSILRIVFRPVREKYLVTIFFQTCLATLK